MALFRKKPSEGELELIVLRAATLAKAKEIDTSELASVDDIRSIITFAFNEVKRKPDANSVKIASASVLALLDENTFLDELLQYQLSHPGDAIPSEFRNKMLGVIQNSVNEFLSSR